MMSLLHIESVSKNFGGLQALTDVSTDVREGSISALIGPNGSGKTTLFNTITKMIPHDSGRIFFAGERIDHLPAHLIPSKGIARTFQIVSLFREAYVWENVASGAFSKTKAEIFSILFRLRQMRSEERQIKERTMETLRFLGIEHLAERPAGMLPIGQQRLVELGRGLVSEPKLLLLDEPLSGLNLRESEAVQQKIIEIRNRGITILFVEHEMKSVMRLAEKITVLNFGRKIAEGRPEEIRSNPEVIEVYLGKEAEIA
jgi:branched-chain amino acid transport system ATP-binding protein